ncbi:type II secretion system protein [Candidatus Parcubacteria bacterium]|nr:MAG: type II secretion system protein [Candidatus Parcubacteria bacterium]
MPKFRKGFSLLEMILYVAIVAIIGTLLVNFIFGLFQGFNKVRAKREVLTNTRLAMERMLADIRSAHSVYTPTSIFGSSFGQLSMETKLNLPADENRTYFDYYVSSSRLYLRRDGGSPLAITSEAVRVTDLVFQYLKNGTSNAESVQIKLTITSPPGGREDVSATTTLSASATVRGNY